MEGWDEVQRSGADGTRVGTCDHAVGCDGACEGKNSGWKV